MAIAGYLRDVKNQQKKLAENLTTKGITASATEKYDSLVSKVAQIEELRGEERVLNNITQYNDTPESIVQLEYPENVEKNIDLQLSSKNLIPYPYERNTWKHNGITYIANSDGSITANGTFENINATSYITITSSTLAYVFKLPLGRTYTSSGSPQVEGVNTTINYCNLENGDTLDEGNTQNGTPKTFTTSTEIPKTGIQLYLKSEGTVTTVDNVVFKPQIEVGSIATEYTPYISDFSTVNVTACGKNLFDNSLLSDWGLTLTNNQYIGIVNNLANKNIGTNFKENTQYTLSIKGFTHTANLTSLLVNISYTDGTTITVIRVGSTEEKTYTYTSSAGKTVNYIKCTFYNSDTITISYIQLELGSNATPYEPYQGTTYTPTSDGKVSGISSIYPITNILTDNAGALMTVYQGTPGNSFIEVLPSEGKNGITKIKQPIVDSSVDFNIKPENIKKDVSILGTVGTLDPTATTTIVEPDYTYDANTKTIYIVMK